MEVEMMANTEIDLGGLEVPDEEPRLGFQPIGTELDQPDPIGGAVIADGTDDAGDPAEIDEDQEPIAHLDEPE
jgi:hypothetical protein